MIISKSLRICCQFLLYNIKAEEYTLYLRSCEKIGAETLHWSNPGDYDYDENEFEGSDYEIVEA